MLSEYPFLPQCVLVWCIKRCESNDNFHIHSPAGILFVAEKQVRLHKERIGTHEKEEILREG